MCTCSVCVLASAAGIAGVVAVAETGQAIANFGFVAAAAASAQAVANFGFGGRICNIAEYFVFFVAWR